MSEFASAAMVRVLAQGMQALGLSVEVGGPGGVDKYSAWVEIDRKRGMVMRAVEQAGHSCLPLLGRGLHALSHEPTHAALVAARTPEDLLMRWQRLERYIHSSHRVAYHLLGLNSVQVMHQPRTGYPAPQPEESLVVLGVLAALLEVVGASGVEVWLSDKQMGDVMVYPQAHPALLERQVEQGNTHTWTIRWQTFVAPSVTVTATPAFGDVSALGLPQGLNLPNWPQLAQQVAALQLCDLMSPRTLPSIATALGVSTRSLQRALASYGLSHSGLIAQCRVLAASRWLLQTHQPLAEVGFLCGFSDQPHFTRAFRQQVGVTPARYRQEFGTGPGFSSDA